MSLYLAAFLSKNVSSWTILSWKKAFRSAYKLSKAIQLKGGSFFNRFSVLKSKIEILPNLKSSINWLRITVALSLHFKNTLASFLYVSLVENK